MGKTFECEVGRLVDGQPKWEVMSVEEVLSLPDPSIRCKECHGTIRLHRAGPGGVPRAHAEHRHRHKGCSL